MNDRVVDRAAAHATPAELAVRDWLLVGLSLATGMYEAICFLTFGKVFTAAQTGNLVLLGIGAAGTHQPAGPNAVTVIISLAAFAVGAALALPILKAFNGDQETEDDQVLQAWPRRVSIALVIALVLQAGFVAVWVTAARPASLAYILMALSVGAGAAGERHPLTPRAKHFHHGLYRHLHRPGQRPRHLVAHRTLGAAPDRFRGRHGRRCLRRRLDAQPRAPVRSGGAGGRHGHRHRNRLGGPEAACHLRPGR
jgi:hypothetical protein